MWNAVLRRFGMKQFVAVYGVMGKRSRFFALSITLVLLLGYGGSACAQLTTTGTINGTVLDPSGAAIPGATVTISETQTRVVTQTVSNADGDFVQVGLNSGHYDVSVSAPGFAGYRQTGIYLEPVATPYRAGQVECRRCDLGGYRHGQRSPGANDDRGSFQHR